MTLDEARRVGDPEADRAVAALGRNVWAVNALLARVHRNDEPLPAAVPNELRPLVVPAVPPWADRHRMRRALAFAEQNLLPITIGLFCASLPCAYGAVAGARILRMSGRMSGDVDRRIHETASFVLDVLRPGGFDDDGHARVAIGKVRLVHAAVRAALLARGAETETPINQEDQAGTLGLFSVVVLKSLVRLGAEVDAASRDDFLHLWRVIGAMLGVHEPFLPTTYAPTEAMLVRIRARQVGPSEDGRVLMRVLLDGMQRHMGVPWLQPLPVALVRYLVGDDAADMLEVPRVDPTVARRSIRAARELRSVVVPIVGRRLLDALTTMKLGGESPSFGMPIRLAGAG